MRPTVLSVALVLALSVTAHARESASAAPSPDASHAAEFDPLVVTATRTTRKVGDAEIDKVFAQWVEPAQASIRSDAAC